MQEPILVTPTLVRLPNGREVELSPGLMEFHPSAEQFVVRYDRGAKTLLRGAETERGTVQWQIITDRGVDVRLTNARRTVLLPKGSATFDGPVSDVVQAGDGFVVLFEVPGGTERFLPSIAGGRPWRTPPGALAGIDRFGSERWRRYGYGSLALGPDERTVIGRGRQTAETIDPVTGEVLGAEQDR